MSDASVHMNNMVSANSKTEESMRSEEGSGRTIFEVKISARTPDKSRPRHEEPGKASKGKRGRSNDMSKFNSVQPEMSVRVIVDRRKHYERDDPQTYHSLAVEERNINRRQNEADPADALNSTKPVSTERNRPSGKKQLPRESTKFLNFYKEESFNYSIGGLEESRAKKSHAKPQEKSKGQVSCGCECHRDFKKLEGELLESESKLQRFKNRFQSIGRQIEAVESNMNNSLSMAREPSDRGSVSPLGEDRRLSPALQGSLGQRHLPQQHGSGLCDKSAPGSDKVHRVLEFIWMVFDIPSRDIGSQLVLGSKQTKKFVHELRTYVSSILSLGLAGDDSQQSKLFQAGAPGSARSRGTAEMAKLNLNQIAKLANFELPMLSTESRNDPSQQVTERFKNFEGLKLPGEDTFRAGLSECKQEELSDSRNGLLSHRSAVWLNEILKTANFAKADPEERPVSEPHHRPFQLSQADSSSLRYSDTASFVPTSRHPDRDFEKLVGGGLLAGVAASEDSLQILSKEINRLTAAPTAETLHPVNSSSKLKKLPEKQTPNTQTQTPKSGSKYAKPFKDSSSSKRVARVAPDSRFMQLAAADDKTIAKRLEASFL